MGSCLWKKKLIATGQPTLLCHMYLSKCNGIHAWNKDKAQGKVWNQALYCLWATTNCLQKAWSQALLLLPVWWLMPFICHFFCSCLSTNAAHALCSIPWAWFGSEGVKLAQWLSDSPGLHQAKGLEPPLGLCSDFTKGWQILPANTKGNGSHMKLGRKLLGA